MAKQFRFPRASLVISKMVREGIKKEKKEKEEKKVARLERLAKKRLF